MSITNINKNINKMKSCTDNKGVKCPICDNIMKTNSWYESVGLVEENHTCSHCGYFYEFVYGNYMEIVNRREFVWDYKCYKDKDSYENFNKILNKNIKKHKMKWKLFGYSCYKKEPVCTYLCGNDSVEIIRGGI